MPDSCFVPFTGIWEKDKLKGKVTQSYGRHNNRIFKRIRALFFYRETYERCGFADTLPIFLFEI